MKNVLVIRYGTIGDSIFASAFYRELRHGMPDAVIDVLVDNTAEGIMRDCPYINDVVYVDGKYNNLLKYIKLFKKYDRVYFLKNDSFFTLVAFFAGVKERVGFDIKRNKFLTLKAPYTNSKHEIDYYLDLLKITNIAVNNDKTEAWLGEESNSKISEFLTDISNKKVLIQAYSRFAQKNWIDKYWVETIKYLSNELKAQVFFVGGKKDIEDYCNIYNLLENEVEIMPINLCGKFSIPESMSLVSKMDMVIGIDSGIIHIAAALNIPSILLHGPTSITRWRPRSANCTVASKNVACSPCCLEGSKNKYCRNKVSDCMKNLTAEEVIDFVVQKFSKIKPLT